MTKKQATDLHIAWMHGYYCGARMKRSSIAQSIRNAAINWPQDLGFVECQIIDSFVGAYERSRWRPNRVMFAESKNTARTFMLLVAEALE